MPLLSLATNTFLDRIPVGRDDEGVEVDGGRCSRHDAHLLRHNLLGRLAGQAEDDVLFGRPLRGTPEQRGQLERPPEGLRGLDERPRILKWIIFTHALNA